jgi:hypothetical protein
VAIETIAIAAGLAYAASRDYGPQETGDDVELDMSERGRVLPLLPFQRVNRWLYLAGELPISALDPYVRSLRAPNLCPTIYYRLPNHNGGKDPTAPDPATRWKSSVTATFVNVTSDCMGGAAWGAGFDRYQPVRFAHLFAGWINTDSMIADALGPMKCFRQLEHPEPGCFVVAASGSGDRRESIGHIGGVVSIPPWFKRASADAWRALGVVDIAFRGRTARANKRTTGAGWAARDAHFIVSRMVP